eukprot:6483968-Amphidinium_carterae.1
MTEHKAEKGHHHARIATAFIPNCFGPEFQIQALDNFFRMEVLKFKEPGSMPLTHAAPPSSPRLPKGPLVTSDWSQVVRCVCVCGKFGTLATDSLLRMQPPHLHPGFQNFGPLVTSDWSQVVRCVCVENLERLLLTASYAGSPPIFARASKRTTSS